MRRPDVTDEKSIFTSQGLEENNQYWCYEVRRAVKFSPKILKIICNEKSFVYSSI